MAHGYVFDENKLKTVLLGWWMGTIERTSTGPPTHSMCSRYRRVVRSKSAEGISHSPMDNDDDDGIMVYAVFEKTCETTQKT